MVDEISINTSCQLYKPSDYTYYITLKDNDVQEDLSDAIKSFDPDIIFWSAISSHLHSEGEYVSIQYGHELMKDLYVRAIKITGGLQPTATVQEIYKRFPAIDYFIRGESELVLSELADNLKNKEKFLSTKGLCYRNNEQIIINPKQDIISNMDSISPYDYSLFENEVFFRPYNGRVVRAVDYELSRGCIYSCNYCVESIIQRYYGFTASKYGMLCNASKYIRNKSAKVIFKELGIFNKEYRIDLIRCQDSNFLTIRRDVLEELADLMSNSDLSLMLYIETRSEGINSSSIKLLKKLKVDGVGIGVEISAESFRKNNLNRFTVQEKIVNVFKLLKKAGIKRTTYNILGLPGEDESMIIETIKFNQLLNPDNISISFFSPYIGTEQQIKAKEMNYFNDYEYDLDDGLRSLSKSTLVNKKLLEFYKKYFVKLVREGIDKCDELKQMEGLK